MPLTDVEKGSALEHGLLNSTVQTFSWSNVSVTVKDRQTKQDKCILANASGVVNAGEIMALMGPSGSGKSTMLDYLAQRVSTSKARTEGDVLLNGKKTTWATLRQISSYVEQEDALIGSITVRETLDFASRLASSR